MGLGCSRGGAGLRGGRGGAASALACSCGCSCFFGSFFSATSAVALGGVGCSAFCGGGGGGGGGGVVASTGGFSLALSLGSSMGVAAATFSATCFGFSDFCPFSAPRVSLVYSEEVMTSTGMSCIIGSSGFAPEKVTRVRTRTPTWSAVDAARLLRMGLMVQPPCSTSVTSATFLKPAPDRRPMTRMICP